MERNNLPLILIIILAIIIMAGFTFIIETKCGGGICP